MQERCSLLRESDAFFFFFFSNVNFVEPDKAAAAAAGQPCRTLHSARSKFLQFATDVWITDGTLLISLGFLVEILGNADEYYVRGYAALQVVCEYSENIVKFFFS